MSIKKMNWKYTSVMFWRPAHDMQGEKHNILWSRIKNLFVYFDLVNITITIV